MRVNIPLFGITVKLFRIKDYHFHIGYDPDTEGKSLYLWNHTKHKKVYKLLKVS